MPMGTKVTLTNYPGTQVHCPGITGCGPEIAEIMQFQVTKRLSGGGDRTTPPEKLKLPAVAPIVPKPHTRRREWVVYQHQLLRAMTFNAVPYMAPSQDFIREGSGEIWEYVHPNHDTGATGATGPGRSPVLQGHSQGPCGDGDQDHRPGFPPPTDAIASIPGGGTELPERYVHHCHLLEHEDDDLMRPWTVVRSGHR
ncbi:hypothetical protein ACFV2H_06645 [Streptomyces sp. NPDC059629]|uniref:hypothetical protein n=1 Tax=Streptomyces sp. NPDC059629 TaxID=3346889 RepID=UPI0036ABD4F5